jgi:hypothetical protein
MRRYGMSVKFIGTTYVEVDVPNGEDPEEYGMDVANPKDVDNWEIVEVYGLDEVYPNA